MVYTSVHAPVDNPARVCLVFLGPTSLDLSMCEDERVLGMGMKSSSSLSWPAAEGNTCSGRIWCSNLKKGHEQINFNNRLRININQWFSEINRIIINWNTYEPLLRALKNHPLKVTRDPIHSTLSSMSPTNK